MPDPVWVYDNWSAYTDGFYQPDDDTRLTEELAMQQLDELVRLKASGVHFDYYMMNAFWFDPDGGYRIFRKSDWPQGPDRWIAACQSNGIKPGLWFGTNSLWKIKPASPWKDSLSSVQPTLTSTEPFSLASMSFTEGGFLTDFMAVLQYWHDAGIRLFEFDVADFAALGPRSTARPLEEVVRSNMAAFRRALKEFRARNPDIMLVAFNGFGGDIHSTIGPFPFKLPVDIRWLEVFDSLYTGDTRVSDTPMMNFWRSVDLFNDHMTRRYEQSGVPLERSDPFCTFSTTHFGYCREKRAWKGMLLLTVARGTWKKTIYGDMALLDDEDARWFAKVQKLYAPLLAMGRTKSFGGIPGEGEAYGFGSFDLGGGLYTIVNPSQTIARVDLPRLSRVQCDLGQGRVLFSDDGFMPELADGAIILGPEQMAVVGFGRFSSANCDLGTQSDVIIPRSIAPWDASFQTVERNSIEVVAVAPQDGRLRVLFWQRDGDGGDLKSKSMTITAERRGKAIPVSQPDQYRAGVPWSTKISWAAGEIEAGATVPGESIVIRCVSDADASAVLSGAAYHVNY